MIDKSPSDLSSMSRAAQRKQRLLDLEKEQRLEDAEALKITEEQRLALFHSFRSVKVEFYDLDGMTWSKSALRRRPHASSTPTLSASPKTSPAPTLPAPPPSPLPSSSPLSAFAVLTNADLATFAPEDTIRVSRFPQPSQSASCTPLPSRPSPVTDDEQPSETRIRRPLDADSVPADSPPPTPRFITYAPVTPAPTPPATPTNGVVLHPILVPPSREDDDDDATDSDLLTPIAASPPGLEAYSAAASGVNREQ